MASNSLEPARRAAARGAQPLAPRRHVRSLHEARSMRNDRIEVHPVAGALGAEILNVDLAQDLGEETVGAIRRAWLEHLVVFFRDQTLEPELFLQLARRFGEVIEYPFVKGIEGFPQITPVVKLENEKMNFGGLWHSDTAYLEQPPMATMLIAREVPAFGGDTLFANMYLAYEALSEGMRRMLAGMTAVHSARRSYGPRSNYSAGGQRSMKIRLSNAAEAEVDLPDVRTHPETGRKALFVNEVFTTRFTDMTEEESTPLLGYLYRHAI